MKHYTSFGVNKDSTIYVAVANDWNQDGIYNDAPNVVTDANDDGMQCQRSTSRGCRIKYCQSTLFYQPIKCPIK